MDGKEVASMSRSTEQSKEELIEKLNDPTLTEAEIVAIERKLDVIKANS